MIHNINATSNDVSFYHEKGYSLLNQNLFADEQFGKLNGIFEEILQNKGNVRADELDVPHFKDERLFEFLMAEQVLDVYVNAADWTWWGGRTIEAMIETGHLELAYQEINSFLDRVIKNDGFYEWYSVIDHQPHGSNTFMGAAGALGKAINLMKKEALK